RPAGPAAPAPGALWPGGTRGARPPDVAAARAGWRPRRGGRTDARACRGPPRPPAGVARGDPARGGGVSAGADALAREWWIEGFRDFLALEAGHSRNTVESYLRDVRRLAEHAAGRGMDGPASLTPTALREFVFALKDVGLAPASIRRAISAIRTYYAFLVGEGRVPADPADRLQGPRPGRTLPEPLNRAEVEALLEAPGVDERLAWRDRALLELGYGA